MKPNETKKQPPIAADPDGIPVYELCFCTGWRDPDLPLEDWRGGSGRLRAREKISITYLPSKRFYRIVQKSLDPKKDNVVVFIPETWASWEPLTSQKLLP